MTILMANPPTNIPASNSGQTSLHSKLNSSIWTPPEGRNATLDLYINSFRKRVQAETLKFHDRRNERNLTRSEYCAIKQLRENHAIVIKPADKGGAIVVMNKEDYIAEANRQLDNSEYYTKISQDPTTPFKRELKKLIKSLPDDELNSQLLASLLSDPQPGVFYLLPKIHKPNNLGRPIISNTLTLTEPISHYVETQLKPYAQAARSYIQDTTHLLQKLSDIGHMPENTLLATMDVSSLYTNISHSNGLRALRNKLPQDTLTDTLIHLTKFILEHNYFSFSDNFYLQTKGTAMGTRMAPQYANIFMADLEEKVLNQTHNQPRLYLRYIDDIFMVWTHGEESLKLFHEKLNKEDPNIKLTLEYSQSQVHFLDTTITIKNSNISTSLYRKPTHSYSYIHPTSSHPPHTFRSVVYSQALRYKRICSEAHDRNQQLATLQEGF